MGDRSDGLLGGGGIPSPHQLNLFLALAKELHFRRAARCVFMSQGAFSQQISALERRLGVALVERTTRRVALTPAGAALVPHAQAVLAATAELQQAAQQQVHAASGRLVIGSLEAITAMRPIFVVLNDLRRRIPDLDIQVLRFGFADVFAALFDGEVDAAFVFSPVPEGIQALPVATGSRCVALASADPLAHKGPLCLADLADR